MQKILLVSCILLQIGAGLGFVVASSLATKPSSLILQSAVADEMDTESSTKTMTLFSPCKINLFLRIIRKREDGFHDLASLFQAIGFGDTLELTTIPGDRDEFECNMEGVPVDDSNLVLRALKLMRENSGKKQYFKANLIKQVPAQAGLGGGSANAATAMWGANELMGQPASLEEVNMLYLKYLLHSYLFNGFKPTLLLVLQTL
jgi:4-diphosphocytidyl-2-C-methyl-D-erythritol kinase